VSAASSALGAASLLLLAAGALKVADPTRTVGALRALGRPVPPAVVRAGAGAEALLGAAGLVGGGRAVAALVAASFTAFAAFVAVALRSGAPVGSCGCFGSADTPPSPLHVVVNLALATGATWAALVSAGPLVDAPTWAWLAAVAVAGAAYLALTSSRQR
jgi:uncharacterized membrane protein YphA (DoxX/SURF4 family)